MRTSKEFFERLEKDEAFAREIGTKVRAGIDAGERDYKALWIPLAAEYGYELTGEELEKRVEAASAELSDDELGKVAGGTTPIAASLCYSAVAGLIVSGVISYITYD